MYNHQCPCCLRGTVPNDYCNTPATTEATDFNHKREHIATTTCRFNDDDHHPTHNNSIRHQTTSSTPQNRKIHSSHELLLHQEQQSSKYFDVCCQNLAIYSVSDPLQINCCKQVNCNCRNGCWQVQNGRINQKCHHHPSNNNQINCYRCCCSRCSFATTTTIITTAALSPDISHNHRKLLEHNHHKIDENSLVAPSYIASNNNHCRDVMSPDRDPDLSVVARNDQYASCSSDVVKSVERNRRRKTNEENKTKMSSRDNNCRKSKKELGIWTDFAELLLGNSRKRNLGSKTKSKSAIMSIFSSVFLLITLLPSFTLAGGKSKFLFPHFSLKYCWNYACLTRVICIHHIFSPKTTS